MIYKKCITVSAQGFGDWIIINPIIRILSKKYEEVGITYNNYSEKIIRNMFSDLTNVKLEFNCNAWLSNINITREYCIENKYDLIDLLCPGNLNKNNSYVLDIEKLNEPFNRCIYTKSGFNWEKDCINYYTPINDNESKKFHKSLNLPEKYIFLHEGPHPKIDKSKILDKNLLIFIPFEIENVFLYKYTIENAEEIHVVNSGFYNFADKLELKTEKYFIHNTRTLVLESKMLDPKLNKNWIEIDY